ncbi:hypothetical protein [Amycolatopsis coloradensis]
MNIQVVIDADTRLVAAVGGPTPGSRTDSDSDSDSDEQCRAPM